MDIKDRAAHDEEAGRQKRNISKKEEEEEPEGEEEEEKTGNNYPVKCAGNPSSAPPKYSDSLHELMN